MAAIIQTRDQLKDYILRRLGSPVINIELTDEQMDDAINDTLDNFLPRAYSGVEERYLFLPFTPGVHDYILDYSIEAVLEVVDFESDLFVSGSTSDLFGMNQLIAQQIFNQGGINKIDILTYEMTNEFMSTINVLFSKKITFDYNCISKKLHLFADPHSTGSKIVHVYRRVEPIVDNAGLESTNVYDVRWIKRMAVEKARYQWGWNLTKYMGSVLPNGMQLNGEAIKATAEAEIEKLMTELHEEWELPADFFVG